MYISGNQASIAVAVLTKVTHIHLPVQSVKPLEYITFAAIGDLKSKLPANYH
jgi:hypothetical protein